VAATGDRALHDWLHACVVVPNVLELLRGDGIPSHGEGFVL
jgi:hypothetical protein